VEGLAGKCFQGSALGGVYPRGCRRFEKPASVVRRGVSTPPKPLRTVVRCQALDPQAGKELQKAAPLHIPWERASSTERGAGSIRGGGWVLLISERSFL